MPSFQGRLGSVGVGGTSALRVFVVFDRLSESAGHEFTAAIVVLPVEKTGSMQWI